MGYSQLLQLAFDAGGDINSEWLVTTRAASKANSVLGCFRAVNMPVGNQCRS